MNALLCKIVNSSLSCDLVDLKKRRRRLDRIVEKFIVTSASHVGFIRVIIRV
jgi:hypothetical protein